MDRLSALEHAHLSRRLIEHVGGLRKAAELCRVRESDLSLYQNPNRPDRSMPGDVISALQVAGGTTLYSDAQRGEVDAPATVIADPMHHACGLIRDASDVLAAVQESMADGSVSATDFTNCDRELAELEERISILRKGLRGAHLREVRA
jgi:hypothetical protein